jgi:predicted transposase/invertase (TIGR01784 family)
VIKYAEEKGMKRGMEKGIEKGIEKGMEKGKKEEREIVAKNMLSLGLEDELVIKATGLDQSIIEKLKKSLSLPTR